MSETLLLYVSAALALFGFLQAIVVMRKRTRTNSFVETSGWEPGWCNWSKSSPVLLGSIEKKILSCLKTSYSGQYVNIGPVVGNADKIWTLTFNEKSNKTPLVLVHGLGAGVGLWVMNLDELAADRPVYALDVLGFGRSSRPTFSSKGKIVELQMVAFLEEWRRQMKIEKMILLGHSLGGYISASYSMQYPDRIKHLILADAWGIAESPPNVFDHYKVPYWSRILMSLAVHLNPLWALRVAGPWGESLIGKARANLVAKFSPFVPNAEDVIPKYLHQCNCQKPTGESAFHSMMHMFAFAKNPITKKKHRLDPDMHISMIFGAKSWVDNSTGNRIKEDRENTDIHVIPESGHHVYLDQPEIFNKLVVDICYRDDLRVE